MEAKVTIHDKQNYRTCKSRSSVPETYAVYKKFIDFKVRLTELRRKRQENRHLNTNRHHLSSVIR